MGSGVQHVTGLLALAERGRATPTVVPLLALLALKSREISGKNTLKQRQGCFLSAWAQRYRWMLELRALEQ